MRKKKPTAKQYVVSARNDAYRAFMQKQNKSTKYLKENFSPEGYLYYTNDNKKVDSFNQKD